MFARQLDVLVRVLSHGARRALALSALTLPLATVWAALSLSGADRTRYQTDVTRPDDDNMWVVARTEGSVAGACQLVAQVDGDASLRLVRAAPDNSAAEVWTAALNENGAHRFVDLPAGTYHLTAAEANRAPAASPAFHCSQHGERGFVVLRTQPIDDVLRGTVSSTAGGVAHGAELIFTQDADDMTALAGPLRIPTAADGSFSTRLLPGRYIVEVVAQNHASQTHKLTVVAGQSAWHASLLPAPHVAGIVVDDTGAPVANADVALGGGFDPKQRRIATRTDAAGRFSLPVAFGQDVVVTAHSASRVGQLMVGIVRNRVGVDDVSVRVQAGRVVQGVVSRVDGSAHAFGAVRYRVRALGLSGVQRADAQGRFMVGGMPSDADVEVWPEGNATGAWGAQVASPGHDQLALVFVKPAY